LRLLRLSGLFHEDVDDLEEDARWKRLDPIEALREIGGGYMQTLRQRADAAEDLCGADQRGAVRFFWCFSHVAATVSGRPERRYPDADYIDIVLRREAPIPER
jgi:hypothetical protein